MTGCAAVPAAAQEVIDSVQLDSDWYLILRERAAGYARIASDNIGREFPSHLVHTMTGPGDFPHRPADRTPVFFGSLDWHSCVEMHWLLVRLLRLAPGAIPADETRDLLQAQFTAEKLQAEAEFVAGRGGRSERPYGWAWALALIHELSELADADATQWLAAMAPLEAALAEGFLAWLPKATYPIRYGVHPNSAFAFSLLLPYAQRRSRGLADAVTAKALEWFRLDAGWAARFEPSGHDFLSPALTEAELMARLLPTSEFATWLSEFLPGIEDREPATLFTPAIVSDAREGQIAHLHGLNASRAWCWRRLAESLPPGDARIGPAVDAASTHLAAALPHVTGSDYMVEHWLAAYAVLAMT
jgi:Protein of unknown function (DUF2891)